MNKYSKKLLRLLITLNILNIINSQTVSSEYMREGFENIIKYKDSRNIIVAGLIISWLGSNYDTHLQNINGSKRNSSSEATEISFKNQYLFIKNIKI